MVCSRDPQRIVSFHSLVTDQDILQCVVKCMSHMQLSCNIRRRHYCCEWFLTSVYFSMKILVLTPSLIEFLFDLFRIVSLCEFFAHDCSPFSTYYVNFVVVFHNFIVLKVDISFNRKKPSTSRKGRKSRGTTLFIYVIKFHIYISSFCNVNDSGNSYPTSSTFQNSGSKATFHHPFSKPSHSQILLAI